MISRRSTVLTVIAVVSLFLGFSGFAWLYDVTRAQRYPVPHQLTGNTVSWDPLYVWQGPTMLQGVSIFVSIAAGFLALWSLRRDDRRQPPPPPQQLPGWTREDDEALRRYLREEDRHHHRRAS